MHLLSSAIRGFSLSRAASSRWTPKSAQQCSQQAGGRKSASFLAPTKFNQKTVGGSVPNAKRNKQANIATTPEVVEVFKHRFIVKTSIRLPHCNSVQQMALTIIAGMLTMIQSRDDVACIVKGGI